MMVSLGMECEFGQNYSFFAISLSFGRYGGHYRSALFNLGTIQTDLPKPYSAIVLCPPYLKTAYMVFVFRLFVSKFS